jgi:hypothetical protein
MFCYWRTIYVAYFVFAPRLAPASACDGCLLSGSCINLALMAGQSDAGL